MAMLIKNIQQENSQSEKKLLNASPTKKNHQVAATSSYKYAYINEKA